MTTEEIIQTTRNLISDTIYYLGGHNSFSVYPNQIYEKERGTAVYSGRPTTWQGKIALPYQSDYGYAANLGKCLDKNQKMLMIEILFHFERKYRTYYDSFG